MKKRFFWSLLALMLTVLPAMAGDDDVMITRDGSMITVKIEKISSSQVTFVDLKHKRRGRLNAPADFVYMIMKDKGNNIFFDEEGNQMTSPVVDFDKDDDVMFLNRGEMFVVYNVRVGRDEISYQLKDKKKAPVLTVPKSDVFMIRNSDGTTTLYNDSYQQKQRARQQAAAQAAAQPAAQPAAQTAAQPAAQPTPAQQAPVQQPAAPATPAATEVPAAQAATAAANGQALLASNTTDPGFYPAPEMSPTDIELKVNAINPYTLYRKGSVAEYCFQYKGKQTQYRGGPTYMQQVVSNELIENGLLVAHIKQEFFNKKHEPSKGIPASFKESLYPVEIDTAGTFHLTHNVAQDVLYIISKRRGFGLLIPGNMQPGMQLKSSTLYDNGKGVLGGNFKAETVYDNWKVEKEEPITTPAGTFNCIKLTGHLSQKIGSTGKFVGEQITCWIARGIGVVQYETIADSDNSREPFIIYLNKLELQ